MERLMPQTFETKTVPTLGSSNSWGPSAAACLRRSVSSLALFAFLGAAACFLPSAATNSAQPPLQPALPNFSGLVERVAPAVVSIRVKANPAAITTRDDDEDEESSGSSEKAPFQATPLERLSKA